VILQIAERVGKAFAASKEVLINAQYLRTAGRVHLMKLSLQFPPEVAFHRGCANAFPFPQPAAVSAIQLMTINYLLLGFAGSLAWLDSRKALRKMAQTLAALPLVRFYFQHARSHAQVLMPHSPYVAAFVPQTGTAAVRAGY